MKSLILLVSFLILAQPVMAKEQDLRPEVIGGGGAVGENFGWSEPYGAIEADALRISLDGSLNGFVEGKVCDACKKIKVAITPETKAYSGRVEVPLKSAKARLGRSATVTFDVKTKKVVKISW